MNYTLPEGHVLVMKTVDADMKAYGGFQWPGVGGVVEPEVWDPSPKCGGGLHGYLWGAGDTGLYSFEDDANWIVFEAAEADVVDLGDKVKVRQAKVVFVGSRLDAANFMLRFAPKDVVVNFCHATAGYEGTATAGYAGTATVGNWGTLISKFWTNGRYIAKVANVGIDGIKANVAYRLDADGNWVEA